MGDRCYVSARIHPMDWHLMYDLMDFPKELSTVKALWDRRSSEPEVNPHAYGDEYTLEGKTVQIEVCEANYGFYDEWHAAAERGARFIAYHSYGSEYGPGNALGLNFQHHYIELTHDGDAFVRLGTDLTISEADLERHKVFREAEKKFESSINKLPDTWEEIIPLCHNKMPNG